MPLADTYQVFLNFEPSKAEDQVPHHGAIEWPGAVWECLEMHLNCLEVKHQLHLGPYGPQTWKPTGNQSQQLPSPPTSLLAAALMSTWWTQYPAAGMVELLEEVAIKIIQNKDGVIISIIDVLQPSVRVDHRQVEVLVGEGKRDGHSLVSDLDCNW